MKRVLGLAAIAAALGIWGGVRAYQSASVNVQVQTGFAIFFGCTLLGWLLLWYRARPGSGDAMVAPTFALLSAAFLVSILPRLLWPAAESVQLAGSIICVIVAAALLVVHIHRRRVRGRGVPPL